MALFGSGGRPMAGTAKTTAQPAAPPPGAPLMAGAASVAEGGELIKEGTDAGFMADVIEASRQQPVIIDFWAPWCGPCRQLTPVLEKAVRAAKGRVKLVKINIDANPRVAAQFRVQSIPNVFVVDNGQPFQGFTGALPESQVQKFVDSLGGAAGPSDLDELLAAAKAALDLGDVGGAAQGYAQALQIEPDNVGAIAGLARCYLTGGDAERAAEVAAMAPPDSKDAELVSVRAALALAAQGDADTVEFENRLAADPNDHHARLDLAKVLAGRGQFDRAADELLTIISRERGWNEDAARVQLLQVFEAAGPTSEVAKSGRRRLSSLLFA